MSIQTEYKTIGYYSEAATTIQKCFRGHLARKGYLSTPSYSAYSKQVQKAASPETDMERAQGGKTRVYLPIDMPEVVLKKSGRAHAITRFHQMQDVRSTLSAQNSSHLTIPKAVLCGDFLVEARLPINIDRFHNMGIYIAEPHLFDEAVREMTRLFSKVYLSDLLSYQNHPINNIVGDTVRYDNLPLYIEEQDGKRVGKIGLIDLEHMQNSPRLDGYRDGFSTLARIFPYHAELIQEEALKLQMPVSKGLIENKAYEGKKYLQEGYICHRDWLLKKGITSKNATEIFELNSDRRTSIKNAIKNQLMKINEGNQRILDPSNRNLPTDFLKEPALNAEELAAGISLELLGNIEASISPNNLKGHALSESEIVALRAPIFFRREICKKAAQILKKYPNYNELTRYKAIWSDYDTFREDRVYEIADHLLYFVLEELVKGGELFSFDHGFNTDGHQFGWLRY